jgi:hypothetical protein
MSLKHTRVAITADDPTADVKMSDWNADHVVDTDGLLIIADASVPAAPAAGNVTVFAKTLAGAAQPAFRAPTGKDSILQPYLAHNKVMLYSAHGNGTTTSAYGGPALTVTTATQRNVATTNLFSAMRRVGSVSAATAGGSCGARTVPTQFYMGGGFKAVFRSGCSDAATVTGARSFVGMVSITTQIGNVNPSTLTSMIGLGSDAGDTNLFIMHNDGSGTATRIDLGANFPDHTLSTDMYELALFTAPNSGVVGYEVTRLNTGHVASGTITTDLPPTNTLLTPQLWRNNGATALAVAIDIVQFYIETDY